VIQGLTSSAILGDPLETATAPGHQILLLLRLEWPCGLSNIGAIPPVDAPTDLQTTRSCSLPGPESAIELLRVDFIIVGMVDIVALVPDRMLARLALCWSQ
jgi:hypothetical protein